MCKAAPRLGLRALPTPAGDRPPGTGSRLVPCCCQAPPTLPCHVSGQQLAACWSWPRATSHRAPVQRARACPALAPTNNIQRALQASAGRRNGHPGGLQGTVRLSSPLRGAASRYVPQLFIFFRPSAAAVLVNRVGAKRMFPTPIWRGFNTSTFLHVRRRNMEHAYKRVFLLFPPTPSWTGEQCSQMFPCVPYVPQAYSSAADQTNSSRILINP
jgi:hypothetical protein